MARRSPEQRFWAKVNKLPGEDACWIWTARNEANRYGIFKFKGKMVLAHRFAWFLETGKWPDPCALHSCDNCHCVRFSHLFEGTQPDNIKDMIKKGRARLITQAKLAPEQVQEIRRLYYTRSFTRKDLSVRFKISRTQIHCIVMRETWKGLPALDCEPDSLWLPGWGDK